MSTGEKILATPVEEIVRMVREEAKRRLVRGDSRYVQSVITANRKRADECGHPRETCGGCRVALAVATALEAEP